MSIQATGPQRRALAIQNALRTPYLEGVPREDWPSGMADDPRAPIAVWRSRDFLVQFYREPAPVAGRLSIHRTKLDGDRWADGITWDELQRLKCEAGFGDCWAVEIYPPESAVVNVANIRHLWLLTEAPTYAWKKESTPA